MEFEGNWRYVSPGPLSGDAKRKFRELVDRISVQGNRKKILETFKSAFSGATGQPHYYSSDEGWASSDLDARMDDATENAPLFIEAFCSGCSIVQSENPTIQLPDIDLVNRILNDTETGFQIEWPRLIANSSYRPIVVPTQPPSLDAQAKILINEKLESSNRALSEGNGRLAVQELLWLLETISTAFRNEDNPELGIQGRYFVKIIKEMRSRERGHQRQILDWMMTLYGYLSSPTGGGIRHGVDLREGLALTANEAQLYCNLVRSYLTFLISEHDRLARNHQNNRD